MGRRELRVGIFDSGVGGLNVLAACVRLLPHCRFYYLGDNARAPYGSRPAHEIVRFTCAALSRFARLGADAALLACNTATAVCAGEMRARFSFPVIGMEPAVAPAARRCSHVLVLATPCTARSARLEALLARHPECRFTVCALPRLAAAIEAHFARGEPLTISDHLPRIACDGVVLGCTHYAFFAAEIAAFYASYVFDGIEGTARRLASLLGGREEGGENGTDDHLRPEQNTNKCFNRMCRKEGEDGVVFLGKAKKLNKRVYFSNICFT